MADLEAGRIEAMRPIDQYRFRLALCLEEAQQVLGPLPAGYAQLREAPPVAAFLTTVSKVVQRIDPAIFDTAIGQIRATV